MSLRPPYGPGDLHTLDIPETSALADGARLLLQLAEALMTAQDFIPVRLDMPDFCRMNERILESVLDVARMLRGETLTRTWERFGPVHLDPRMEPEIAQHPGAARPVRFRTALNVTLPGIEHQVGKQLAECVAAQIDPDSVATHDDHVDAYFVPAGSDVVRVRYIPEVEAPCKAATD